MDKELPESALAVKPPKSYIRVSKSNLPGYKGYKASVIFRSTIGIETIAERIVKKRSIYGKEWEAIIGSQFNPAYRPYQQERYGYLTFTVV